MSQQNPPSATNRVSLTLTRRPSVANRTPPVPVQQPNAANRTPPAPVRQPSTTNQTPPAPVRQPYAADWTSSPPVRRLNANKGLLKYILLSGITFGIYGIVVMSSVSDDINIIASRYDGRRTMHYCLMLFLIGPITLGIGWFFWYHNISERIGIELERRNIPYSFGAGSFWLWDVLGVLIVIGPLVYSYKLFKATNKLCQHYNMYG